MAFGIGEKFEKNIEISYPDTESITFFYRNTNGNEIKPEYFVVEQKVKGTFGNYIINASNNYNEPFESTDGEYSLKYTLNLEDIRFQQPKYEYQARILDNQKNIIDKCNFSVINNPDLLRKTRRLLVFRVLNGEGTPTFYLNDNLIINRVYFDFPSLINNKQFDLTIKIFTYTDDCFDTISKTITVINSGDTVIPINYKKKLNEDSCPIGMRWYVMVFLDNEIIGRQTYFKVIPKQLQEASLIITKSTLQDIEKLDKETKTHTSTLSIMKKTKNLLCTEALDSLFKISTTNFNICEEFRLDAIQHLSNANNEIDNINHLSKSQKEQLKKTIESYIDKCLFCLTQIKY